MLQYIIFEIDSIRFYFKYKSPTYQPVWSAFSSEQIRFILSVESEEICSTLQTSKISFVGHITPKSATIQSLGLTTLALFLF